MKELYHYAILLPKKNKRTGVCITNLEASLKQGYHQCHFLRGRFAVETCMVFYLHDFSHAIPNISVMQLSHT